MDKLVTKGETAMSTVNHSRCWKCKYNVCEKDCKDCAVYINKSCGCCQTENDENGDCELFKERLDATRTRKVFKFSENFLKNLH